MKGIEYILELFNKDKKSLITEFNIPETPLDFNDFANGYNFNLIIDIIMNMTGVSEELLRGDIDNVSRLKIIETLIQREMDLYPHFGSYSPQLTLFGPEYNKGGLSDLASVVSRRHEIMENTILQYFDELDVDQQQEIVRDLYIKVKDNDEEFTLDTED